MPSALRSPCLLPPICGPSCAGAPCAGGAGHEAKSNWGKHVEGDQRLHHEPSRPGPSTSEVHAAVGRALEDLQFYVSTELMRMKDLLDFCHLPVPHGDTAAPDPDPGTCQMPRTPAVSPKASVGARLSRASSAKGGSSSSPTSSLGAVRTKEVGGRMSPKNVVKLESGWTSARSRQQAELASASRLYGTDTRSQWEIKEERMRHLPPLQRLVRSNAFDLFWIVAVVANSLLVGVQTQHAAKHLGEEEPVVFRALQYTFTFMFSVELILRIWAYGCKTLFTGPARCWAYLDVLMVIGSIFEVAAEVFIPVASQAGAAANNIRSVRVIRVARVLRALRIERLIYMVSSLRTLVLSIAATLKSLMWAMLLLVLIMYVVGITLTECIVGWRVNADQSAPLALQIDEYWRSLDVSMFTLFQSISGGLSWHDAVRPLEDVSLVLSWIFTAYVGFTYFAVLNVVTGVFCNAAIESAQRNPEVVGQNLLASRKVYVENLEKLFEQVDEDSNEVMSFNEIEQLFSDPDNRVFLSALEIEAADAWTLFKLIDLDKDGVVQKDEFISGCLQVKGLARNMELANLSYEVSRLERKLRRYMAKISEVRDLLRQSLGNKVARPASADSHDSA